MTDKTFDSLREYVEYLDDRGVLKHLEGADWDLEIGGLTETVAFRDNPRPLLFDSINEYPEGQRIVTNPFVTEELQAVALGLPEDATGIELVEAWREREIEHVEPETVADGPITENVMRGSDVDILEFPVPRWHDEDGGRYFGTGDSVITRTYDGDWVNVAPYRVQVHDEQTLGIFINQVHHGRHQMQEFWDRGEAAPIVILGGQSPHVYAAGCIPLSKGEDELAFAGGIKGEPIEVIEHEETGLPIPAHAESAVIGHVPPPEEETKIEGPFGECTGYYAGTTDGPVIHIDEIWHRDDPILQGNPTLYGPTRKFALGGEIVTSAQTWEAIEEDIPNIQGVYALYQQCQVGSDITVVSIEQEYAGHAKQAAAAALGAYANVTMNDMVIVVDEDIDPADTEEVLFALTTRCDPAEDIDVVEGLPTIELDPLLSPEKRENGDLTNSAMLVNACKPYYWKDEFPIRNVISEEHQAELAEEWNVDEWT